MNLVKGAFKLHPRLVGKEAEGFVYGYNLKRFPDEPIKVGWCGIDVGALFCHRRSLNLDSYSSITYRTPFIHPNPTHPPTHKHAYRWR